MKTPAYLPAVCRFILSDTNCCTTLPIFLIRQKLTFQIRRTSVCCGVPDVYVYCKTALIFLFAPLTVFAIIFVVALLNSVSDIQYLFASVAMALHPGGCIGDLYDIRLLSRCKEETELICDEGTKQVFCRKKQS